VIIVFHLITLLLPGMIGQRLSQAEAKTLLAKME